ncbi:hypothetical protein [Ruegeria hyattellae]|uniref:hypothetical protein n=1 Tax=Ruegeria hyattellae TaxID=3233337 RepID=UPI00355B1854
MSDDLSPEEQSKDKFFGELSKISEDMIGKHGKDFAMGALVMAAQWIAKNDPDAQNDTKH